MSLGFPSGSTDLKFTKFKKNWRFDSSTKAWRMEPISGSYLDDLEDVDLTGLVDGAYLVLTGSEKWIPKSFTGSYTGSYFESYQFSQNLSDSIITFTDNNGVDTNIALPQNVYAEADGEGGYFLFSSGSEQIKFLSASYAVTSANAETANTVDFYPFDNYVEGVNLSANTLYYSMSYGVVGEWEIGQYSASINKYTNLPTIVFVLVYLFIEAEY